MKIYTSKQMILAMANCFICGCMVTMFLALIIMGR
jgi:hypothetical protein